MISWERDGLVENFKIGRTNSRSAPPTPSTREVAIKLGDEASNLQWSEEGEGGAREDERKEVSVAVV